MPKPFHIGSVLIDPPLVLAPMAGVSHSPFRRLVAGFGRPGLFFSEMLSARHLQEDVKKNSLWLRRSDIETPMAYQIVAASPEEAEDGAREIVNFGGEIIDLNLACPAPNIGRRKAGAHLLSDLTLIEKMLSALRQSVSCPLTVKIRLGDKPDLTFLQELNTVISQCRIDAITIHPRLIKDKLKRRARWEYIGHLKEMTHLPVIGNGDVKTSQDCLRMFKQTGCDGVMIGRAAVQKPWLFAEIIGKQQILSPEFLLDTYKKEWDLITGFFPEPMALGRIKEFTWHFSGNLKFGHRYAARMQSIRSIKACEQFRRENFIKAA